GRGPLLVRHRGPPHRPALRAVPLPGRFVLKHASGVVLETPPARAVLRQRPVDLEVIHVTADASKRTRAKWPPTRARNQPPGSPASSASKLPTRAAWPAPSLHA